MSAEVERLWRFLLGEASEAERLAIEDEFFAGAEQLTRVETAEDELIDAYVCGELPAERRQRFAERFLATPSQRARVAVAEALAARAAPATATATEPRARRDPAAAARPRRRLRPALLSLATAGLVAALGMLALMHTRVTVVSASLSPMVLRGQMEAPTIHLGRQPSRLQLHLALDEPLPADVVAVMVAWRREGAAEQTVPATRDAGQPAISLVLDGAQLAAGSYELVARVQRANRAPEDFAVYAFRIANR